MMPHPTFAAPSASDVSGTEAPARRIQELTTPQGITVWLMESHTLPMVNVDVSFKGGSAFEPTGQEGVAQLTASLLDEGAGTLEAKAFKEALEAIGARFGGSASTQEISVGLTTLSEHAEDAFRLLGLAVTATRFDAEAVERMRSSTLASIRRGNEDPATVAWRLFRPAVYGTHPYGRDGEGTEESVTALTVEQMKAWQAKVFTKSNMGVVVVGDVTSATAIALVDNTLGSLPEGTGRLALPAGPSPTVPSITRTHMPVPQGTVLLGHLGMNRHDPDYPAMLVMNEILGGGVLTSRLGADVREKHGLVYDVRSVNAPLPYNGMFYVSLATDNAKVEKALSLVRKHLHRILTEDVTDAEFDDAKAYLVGSFPLRVDSNGKLVNMLSMMQGEEMGVDYLETWPQRIEAVSKADIRRVANKLIHPEAMTLVVVGDGPALEAK